MSSKRALQPVLLVCHSANPLPVPVRKVAQRMRPKPQVKNFR